MRRELTLEQFEHYLTRLPAKCEKAVIRGLRDGAMKFANLIVHEIDQTKPYPPIDRGEMRASVSMEPTSDGANVVVDAPHAIHMEYGTRPFMPPFNPLFEWAKRKGFDNPGAVAKATQMKIAERGLAPRRFMRRAAMQANIHIANSIRREIKLALKP